MYFTNFLTILSITLVTTVSAIPLESGVTPRSIKPFQENLRYDCGEGMGRNLKPTGCNLMDINLPFPKTNKKQTQLARPKNIALVGIVLGLGTQNYTCAATNSTKVPPVPVFLGAIADLYDASYLARNNPKLLHELPGALVNTPHGLIHTIAVFTQALLGIDNLVVGKHFFPDITTPAFDFSKTFIHPATGKGKVFLGNAEEKIPAPASASKGIQDATKRNANGAVDWLRLGVKNGTVGYKAGYRLVTAGGKPPADCSAFPQGGNFEVPYAAEYWFYT